MLNDRSNETKTNLRFLPLPNNIWWVSSLLEVRVALCSPLNVHFMPLFERSGSSSHSLDVRMYVSANIKDS